MTSQHEIAMIIKIDELRSLKNSYDLAKEGNTEDVQINIDRMASERPEPLCTAHEFATARNNNIKLTILLLTAQ